MRITVDYDELQTFLYNRWSVDAAAKAEQRSRADEAEAKLGKIRDELMAFFIEENTKTRIRDYQGVLDDVQRIIND